MTYVSFSQRALPAAQTESQLWPTTIAFALAALPFYRGVTPLWARDISPQCYLLFELPI